MSGHSNSLLESIDACKSEMMDFTRDLIAIPTENPPGNHYTRCAEVITQKLKQIGLDPRVTEVPAPIPSEQPGYCLTAVYGESEPVLYFHSRRSARAYASQGARRIDHRARGNRRPTRLGISPKKTPKPKSAAC
jgi:hypothetical protein